MPCCCTAPALPAGGRHHHEVRRHNECMYLLHLFPSPFSAAAARSTPQGLWTTSSSCSSSTGESTLCPQHTPKQSVTPIHSVTYSTASSSSLPSPSLLPGAQALGPLGEASSRPSPVWTMAPSCLISAPPTKSMCPANPQAD